MRAPDLLCFVCEWLGTSGWFLVDLREGDMVFLSPGESFELFGLGFLLRD